MEVEETFGFVLVEEIDRAPHLSGSPTLQELRFKNPDNIEKTKVEGQQYEAIEQHQTKNPKKMHDQVNVMLKRSYSHTRAISHEITKLFADFTRCNNQNEFAQQTEKTRLTENNFEILEKLDAALKDVNQRMENISVEVSGLKKKVQESIHRENFTQIEQIDKVNTLQQKVAEMEKTCCNQQKFESAKIMKAMANEHSKEIAKVQQMLQSCMRDKDELALVVEEGCSPDMFFKYCENGEKEKVQAALQFNPSVAARQKLLDHRRMARGVGQLHVFCTPLHAAIRECHLEVVRCLAASSANLNARDAFGWTPLMWAVYYNKKSVVRLLIELGSNLYCTSSRAFSNGMVIFPSGSTALMVAEKMNRTALISVLSKAAIKPGARMDEEVVFIQELRNKIKAQLI